MLKKQTAKWLLLMLGAVVILGAAAAGMYLIDSAKPTEQAMALASQYEDLKTAADGYIYWQPRPSGSAGLIFYQGGKVQALAYAPLLLPLVDQGISVFLPEMPFNLAVFKADVALRIMAAHPEITTWWIGGHSLGGAMAASFVYDHPSEVAGLLLLAAYPQDSKPINGFNGQVLAFFATRDGLVNTEEIPKWADLLPAQAEILRIEGGNHAQFGSYGPQKGDLTAEIAEAAQQNYVREAWLERIASSLYLTFEGVVEEVSGGQMLVRAADFELFDLAWVSMMPEALVLNDRGEASQPEALRSGMNVAVTILPAIRESYPVQVSAVKVVIRP